MTQQLEKSWRDRLEQATARLEQIEQTLIELDRLEQQRDRQAIADIAGNGELLENVRNYE